MAARPRRQAASVGSSRRLDVEADQAPQARQASGGSDAGRDDGQGEQHDQVPGGSGAHGPGPETHGQHGASEKRNRRPPDGAGSCARLPGPTSPGPPHQGAPLVEQPVFDLLEDSTLRLGESRRVVIHHVTLGTDDGRWHHTTNHACRTVVINIVMSPDLSTPRDEP
jgi:hypothetical protein